MKKLAGVALFSFSTRFDRDSIEIRRLRLSIDLTNPFLFSVFLPSGLEGLIERR